MGRSKDKPPQADERTDVLLDRLTRVTERLERLADQLAVPDKPRET